jgi:hypothetical protein
MLGINLHDCFIRVLAVNNRLVGVSYNILLIRRNGGSASGSSLQVQNVVKFDNAFIAVCGSTLPSLANSSKRKVIQLAAKGCKGRVVKVAW